jgi:uncharacterized protein YPO0396
MVLRKGPKVCLYESAKSRIFRCRRKQDDLSAILELLREDYPYANELIQPGERRWQGIAEKYFRLKTRSFLPPARSHGEP